MPTLTSQVTASVLGSSFTVDQSVSAESGVKCEPACGPGWAGILTVRTDNDTGTVTITNAAHTVATGARVDVYWTGGSRRGVTVGTVAGTSVPIDLGAGDNLPVANTAVVVSVAVEAAMTVTGNSVVGLAASLGVRGTVVFATSANAECHAVVFADGGGHYVWTSVTGLTNPLAGDAVAKVFATHALPTGTVRATAVAVYD